jgi:PhoH-like ATPase
VVLTGDPEQIDNPYVDASSNGLTYVVERFKNSPISGHITLRKGERSQLAEAASNLL